MVLNSFTVLCVEDSKLQRETIKKIILPYAKDVYTTVDGKDGIDQFLKLKPDIVITDINMPNIDGMQMSKMIKNRYPETPIILLTQFDKIENLKKAIYLGIDSFMSKPPKEDDLIKVLESIAIKLQHKLDAKKLKEIEANQEKVESLLVFLKEIGHHWRQPLSAVTTIATSYQLKKENNLYNSVQEEINDIARIPEKINKLNDMLLAVQNIDFNKIELHQLEKIIQISDPIYNNS